jgi:hypothetical protein
MSDLTTRPREPSLPVILEERQVRSVLNRDCGTQRDLDFSGCLNRPNEASSTSARCRFVGYARCSGRENSLATTSVRGIVVKVTQRYLIPALVAPVVLGLVVAPPATADCTSSGYATVCAQGDVRGGDGGSSTVSGPVYPYPCADDWLCNDGVDIAFGPIWPGRPDGIGGGRPGGIGPR